MKKRNYWPLFFIGIFSFVFSMIIWTIVQTSKASLDADLSFMKKYQDVDENYNTIIESNMNFLSKYDLQFIVNGKDFGLTTEDIRYGQRVIEKHSQHKDLLKLGENELEIKAVSKDLNQAQDIKIELVITKAMSNDSDIVLNDESFENSQNSYTTKFNIDKETNWNITGSIATANSTGYIFIKTNAK